ncbi:MAG: alpha/beta hydrolase [Allopontixanthobacter sediminis]
MTGYREHRYGSADQRLTLFARDYPGEQAGAPALLLMHGLTRNSADFEALADHLAGKYRLVVADQRGRGLSDYDPKPANYRPDVYAKDMWALLDSLDIRQAGLIGTSLGGLMAMLMAATEPARVRAIVLNDVGAELMEEGIERIRSYAGQDTPMANWNDAADRCKQINAAALPDLGNEDWLAFARRTCAQQADGTIAFNYDPAISQEFGSDAPDPEPADLWHVWDTIKQVPALVLRGQSSDVLSPDTVNEMHRRHDGPFVSVTVPNRGHAPLLDEPEAVAEIEGFLQNHLT